MSKTQQLTFGGVFRRLIRDLEDVSRDARGRFLICACQEDDTYCADDIRKVEGRIVEAVVKLPVQTQFKYMTNEKHTFKKHWETLEEMKLKWINWLSAWKESTDQRGDIINDRPWKKHKEILEKVRGALIISKPSGFEEDPEWTQDYRDGSCIIAVTHTPRTDTDSIDRGFKDMDIKYTDPKATQSLTRSDIPLPHYTAVASNTRKPTFGYFFRLLIQDLRDLVDLAPLEGHMGTNTISVETQEDISRKALKITQNVDSLQENMLLEHMSSTWTTIHWYKSQPHFVHAWRCLVEVCAKWKSS